MLTLWAAANSKCSYKQGMNEIAGALWVIYNESGLMEFGESSLFFVFDKILREANHQQAYLQFGTFPPGLPTEGKRNSAARHPSSGRSTRSPTATCEDWTPRCSSWSTRARSMSRSS